MKNAVKASFEYDDQEGSAGNAAVLGADGGPASAPGTDLAILDDDFGDDDWLDEELTDEELAALGEEDFDTAFADFDDEEFVESDLGDLDDLDDFDVMDDDEGQEPRLLEAAPSFPSSEVEAGDGEFGDDLFGVVEDEPAVTAGSEADLADNEEFNHQHDKQSVREGAAAESIKDGNITDDDLYNDEESLDFEAGDDFSIDDDYSGDAAQMAAAGAVIVADESTELKAQPKGDVVVSEGDLTRATDMDHEDDSSESGDDFSDLDDDGTFHRPVPRISIHAFCETSRNSSILEKAAVDRRLMKAHFTMHMGGLEKAIDLYQGSSTPNLIILETVAGGAELIQQLGQLAEVCDPSTKVVLIGRVNDIRPYR